MKKYVYFIFLSLTSVLRLHSQEVFYVFDGDELLPDAASREKLGIKVIQREVIEKYGRVICDLTYLNDLGKTDSILRWSGDDDDSLLCISKHQMSYQQNKLKEQHLYWFYNVYQSGEDGNQWVHCQHEYHFEKHYGLPENRKALNQRTRANFAIQKNDSISFYYNNVKHYVLNDTVEQNFVYTLNDAGNESNFLVTKHLNNDGVLMSITTDSCSGGNCLFYSKVIYKYNATGKLIQQTQYSRNDPNGKVIRTAHYDKKGNLIYEEVAKRDIGIKSRAYAYNKKGQLIKIKEMHFDGFVERYSIAYDKNGLLQEIVTRSKYGKDVQKFTYVLSD